MRKSGRRARARPCLNVDSRLLECFTEHKLQFSERVYRAEYTLYLPIRSSQSFKLLICKYELVRRTSPIGELPFSPP